MTEILSEIRSIKQMLVLQQSEYVDTNGAAAIIGLLGKEGKRGLLALRKMNLIAYAPGRGNIYRRSDCEAVRQMFEDGQLVLKKGILTRKSN